MVTSRFYSIGLSAFLSIIFPTSAFSQQCAEYKYPALGVKVIESELGPKIVSTDKVAVFVNDVDEMKDAYEEAKLNAKMEIVKFMEGSRLNKECTNSRKKLSNRLVSKDKSGESGSYNAETIKEIICNSRESASGFVRGAQIVEDCYKEGEYVLVTVGVSPKSLINAAKLSKNMNNAEKLNKNMNSSANSSINNNSGNKSNGLVPTEGFHNFDEDF
tara:strand:+ start:718 stop:1365 length:648 start_codon:yes stop_codon:yes gene_type:complete